MTRASPLRRQRGVAVITALLLTALAITIVASLFWQQQVQVRSMENQRLHLQTKWILRGSVDFARFALREDGFDPRGKNATFLDGIWATPLAETRLDDYIERERVEGESFDATLSGQISDAQARYNLSNLATNRAINPAQVAAFGRLLENVRLDPGLAPAAAEAVRMAQRAAPPLVTPPPGTVAAPAGQDGALQMPFLQVEDLLAVPGFTPQAVQALRDFVVVLPEAAGVCAARGLTQGLQGSQASGVTQVNVNTASAEVLAAVVDGLSVAEANAMVASRKQKYFADVADFIGRSNGKKALEGVGVGVKSSYFLAVSRVRLDRAALDAQALIYRDASMNTCLVSIREN